MGRPGVIGSRSEVRLALPINPALDNIKGWEPFCKYVIFKSAFFFIE